MTPDWGHNLASASDITYHLNGCGTVFTEGLRARVDIDAYALKILLNAERFEAWSDGKLIGLLAIYCNNPQQTSAFITNLSVLEEWRGRGIAGALLERSMALARQKRFETIRLEVEAKNTAAVAVYRRYGFVVLDGEQSMLTMKRDLG
ncbi:MULTISPECIES: GNAT family N-acetyltransferase [Rhizobium]|uniref:GNAT family N-acetyltransferase n=1 Tax=Rhizobium phaseoli TaxID=396 RepID=UPI000A1C0A5B|nr:GNAT family N-acetyltransferase [Rhizobium phaseoli]ARM11782.1 GCN5-related N-acetyltransferase protein [Rhizobium phaseoli Brasil 5]